MKQLFLTCSLLFCVVGAIFAQDAFKTDSSIEQPSIEQRQIKIGYINKQALINSIPAVIDLENKLKELKLTYEAEYTHMTNEYNKKVRDYIEANKSLSEPIKMARQTEIIEMEKRMVLYKERYTAELDKQRSIALSPILVQVDTAIKDVARELKISIVFDQNTPLYTDESCIDLMPIVKVRLQLI